MMKARQFLLQSNKRKMVHKQIHKLIGIRRKWQQKGDGKKRHKDRIEVLKRNENRYASKLLSLFY